MQIILERLISQAEEEGITLAQVMTRELSMNEIDQVQESLRTEMADNYAAIEDFMENVEVPGSYDFSSISEEQLTILQEELMYALSDTPLRALSEA